MTACEEKPACKKKEMCKRKKKKKTRREMLKVRTTKRIAEAVIEKFLLIHFGADSRGWVNKTLIKSVFSSDWGSFKGQHEVCVCDVFKMSGGTAGLRTDLNRAEFVRIRTRASFKNKVRGPICRKIQLVWPPLILLVMLNIKFHVLMNKQNVHLTFDNRHNLS